MAFALLHPTIREEASKYLGGKLSKDDQNQSDKPVLNFWQKSLDIFSKMGSSIVRPDVMDLPNIDPSEKLDPINCDFNNRNAQWMKETWETYIRPIYKKVLIKWFKDTGGGPRTLENFINYCTIHGKTSEWLVWIYAMDETEGLLLGSRCGAGRPKCFATQESGFEYRETHGAKDYETPAKTKKSRSGELTQQLENNRKDLQDLLGVMKARVSATAVDPIDQGFEAMEKIDSHKRRVEADEDHTPNSKEALLQVLKKRKKGVGKKILELSKEEEKEEE